MVVFPIYSIYELGVLVYVVEICPEGGFMLFFHDFGESIFGVEGCIGSLFAFCAGVLWVVKAFLDPPVLEFHVQESGFARKHGTG